ERHQEEREKERRRRADLAEEHERQAEDGHADPDQRARAEAVGQPALDRPEDAALGPRHREGHREQRLAPAEFLAEQHDVRAVRVEEERAHQHLEDEAGGDDSPAVEDTRADHCPGSALTPPRPGERRQATRRPCSAPSRGSSRRHRAITCGQRVWKRQPGGGSSGLGISPLRMISSRRAPGSSGSAAEKSACVYGCFERSATSAAEPSSTICPRYMTAIVSLMCATAARSGAM